MFIYLDFKFFKKIRLGVQAHPCINVEIKTMIEAKEHGREGLQLKCIIPMKKQVRLGYDFR